MFLRFEIYLNFQYYLGIGRYQLAGSINLALTSSATSGSSNFEATLSAR